MTDELEFPRADALAELTGRAVAGDASSSLWSDERLLAWLADDARGREDRRTSDMRAEARGRAFMLRALARRYGVQRLGRASMPLLGDAYEAEGGWKHGRVSPLVELGVAAGVGRDLWDEPAEQWIAVPPELPAGEYVALKIAGQSMAPLMHTGDTVLVRRGGALRAKSIVVARRPDDGYVCKVVHRVRGGRVELASLEPGRPLIVIPHDRSLVLGTVAMIWSAHEV